MATTLTFTHPSINSGVAVSVLCGKLTVQGKKNNTKTPNSNINGSQVEVQTNSVENPVYVLSGVHFTNAANTLTYPMLLTLYKLKYGGSTATGSTAAITMQATYGRPGSTIQLVGFDGSSTSIKVVLEDFNFPIDMSDSKDGYRPVVSITLVETA